MADIVSGSEAPVKEDTQGKKSAVVNYVTNIGAEYTEMAWGLWTEEKPILRNKAVAVDQSKDGKEVRLQVNNWTAGEPRSLDEQWVAVGADNKVSINGKLGVLAPEFAQIVRDAVTDSLKDGKLDPKEAKRLDVLIASAPVSLAVEKETGHAPKGYYPSDR